MENYKDYFKGKKITIMGLGLLGRGVAYTKFLASQGAILTVTDLKTKDALRSSLKELAHFTSIKFVLGEHRLSDFQNRDMVIKSAGVPLDSPYIAEARKNKIPIEMDASLFARCAPEVTIVGVTGTRGKSMTTTLIHEILKSQEKILKRKVYLGGNIRGMSTLPLLSKVKKGDIVILELDSWQLQGFGEAKISPHISVFTTFMPDHMNYYKNNLKKYFADKANIFKYQKKGDVLVIRPDMKKLIPQTIKSTLIVANKKAVAGWSFAVPGEHQRENLACVVEVAKQFGIPLSRIKTSVKNFKGIEGRLQYVKTVKGVKIYNDNNATTPEATIAGLEALAHTVHTRYGLSIPGMDNNDKRKKPAGNARNGGPSIILIAGGATKNLNASGLVQAIGKYCKAVVLLSGKNTTGTEELLSQKLKVESYKVADLKGAVKTALGFASRGDIILFSPAFASFGMFTNEYDRNDQFMKIIKKLK